MQLMIILGSNRPESRGRKVADWVKQQAERDSRLEIDFVDASVLNLPFYNQPASPFTMKDKGQEYTSAEGRDWVARVDQANAFILVVAEYNHGYTALLKNTLDWAGREWSDKPVSFVSYSTGMTGGARAVEQLRPVVTELGLAQVANAIHFPRVDDSFDENGQPTNPAANDNLQKMFNELFRLHSALAKR